MKATKRLLKAIIALVASVVLCIGVCLAWFAANKNVDASGMNSQIKSTNISAFTVTAYYLTDPTESGDALSYTVGKAISDDEMFAYGNIDNVATAILLKFACTFIEETGKKYDIAATFSKDNITAEVEAGSGEFDLKCNLSEVLDFFKTDATGAVVEGDTVTRGAELSPNEDNTQIDLNDGAATDNPLTYTFYCIIDYNEDEIQDKYFYALNNIEGCSLSSKMRFENNMSFYVAEA